MHGSNRAVQVGPPSLIPKARDCYPRIVDKFKQRGASSTSYVHPETKKKKEVAPSLLGGFPE